MTCSTILAGSHEAMGKTDKLRVLVDKVIMTANDKVMTEDHVRAIAEAGFNVVSPRWGNEDMNEARKIARAAGKHGISHMPFMRGTLDASGKVRMVWSNDVEQTIASPNADELWDWLTGEIVNYARISRECPAMIGVCLDFENYAEGHPADVWQCYFLSYDRKIMDEFAAAKGLTMPERAPDKGGWCQWLKEQKLHDEFTAFQVNHWRERCRKLRQAVDAVNPAFHFCIYPSYGSPFIEEAVYREWGTKAAPLILADRSTYGRSKKMHRESIEGNRQKLRQNMARARAKNLPNMLFMGGIDPIVRGADPEFSGRNAALSAAETDGYWIFYEGPKFGSDDHRTYWDWFTRANRAILQGKQNAFADAERETPDPGAGADNNK